MWRVGFIPWQLYIWPNNPHYPATRRMNWSQSLSGCFRQKNLLPPPGITLHLVVSQTVIQKLLFLSGTLSFFDMQNEAEATVICESTSTTQ
jgi:hypothetical protein